MSTHSPDSPPNKADSLAFPENALAETRAALAPALAATAAILPWLHKPQTPKYAPVLNARWQAACKTLAQDWASPPLNPSSLRQAIMTLYQVAIEISHVDLLALTEALLTCADEFEHTPPGLPQKAAFSATIECLLDRDGLEHPAIDERARHFSRRLSDTRQTSHETGRSTAIDRLFVDEALDHLDHLHAAMAALPVDAYTLSSEAAALAYRAEQLELWGIMHLAQEIVDLVNCHAEYLELPNIQHLINDSLNCLHDSILAVDA